MEDNAYLPEGALNQSSEYLHNAEKWDESAHGGNSAYDINGNVIDQTEYDGTDCKQSSIAQDQYDQYGNVIPLNESAPVEQEFGVDDNDNFTIGWDQNASSYQQYDESILQSNGYIENSHSEQLYEDYGNPANTNEWDQNATEPAEAMDINMTPYQPAAEFGNGQKWIPNGILEQHITDGWEQSNEELDEKSRVEQQYDEYSINAVDAQEWDKTALPNQQWINVANFEQQYDEFGNVLGTQQLEQNLSSYSNWDENLNAGSWQQDEVDGLEAVVELVCDNCRKINELDSNFCVKCGNALIRHPVVLPPPPIAPATQAKAKAQSLEPHIDAASVPHIHQGANGLRDPLQREQGHCLAIFGFGGKVITMCPKRQIMYQSDGHGGQVAMEKIYPGMIAIKRVEKYLFSYISEELRSRNPIFSNVKIKKDTLKSELNTLRSCKVATEEYLLLIDYIENLLDNDCSTKS